MLHLPLITIARLSLYDIITAKSKPTRPAFCKLEKKVGPCRAGVPRFYFDKNIGRCEHFMWGGCKPNGNNFKTKIECEKACQGKSYSLLWVSEIGSR